MNLDMIFEHLDNNPIFNEFISKYRAVIDSLYPELQDITIRTRTDNKTLSDTPFEGITTEQKITCSAKYCIACDLTDDEKLALIAHEVGHFVVGDYIVNLDEEKAADQVAVRLVGSSSTLKNALQKMLDYYIKNEVHNEVTTRTDSWADTFTDIKSSADKIKELTERIAVL